MNASLFDSAKRKGPKLSDKRARKGKSPLDTSTRPTKLDPTEPEHPVASGSTIPSPLPREYPALAIVLPRGLPADISSRLDASGKLWRGRFLAYNKMQRCLAAILLIFISSVVGLPSERLSRSHMAHLSLRLRGGGGGVGGGKGGGGAGGGGVDRRTGTSSGHLWSDASHDSSLVAKGIDPR